MRTALIGGAGWLATASLWRNERARIEVLARTVGLVTLAGILGLALSLARAPADATEPRTALPNSVAEAAGKDAARLSSWSDRSRGAAAEPGRTTPAGAGSALGTAESPSDPHSPAASRPAGDGRPLAAQGLAAASPWPAAKAADARSDWREEEFAHVAVVDGRTLQAGRMRIELAGVELPKPDEVCRTLDGRLEACAARAATQLELLTRWRKVSCHYRPGEASDEGVGHCRVGSSDLGQRMLRTGFARRTAERHIPVAAAGAAPDAN
jgi:endonuclease YncB( thermonuclease family)